MHQLKAQIDPKIIGFIDINLAKFITANPAVRLAVLTSADGFEIATHPGRTTQSARIAAMSSSMQALSQTITNEVQLSNCKNLIVESDNGAVIIVGLEGSVPSMSLAVVVEGQELLGKVLWSVRNVCRHLEGYFRQSS